MQHKMNFEFNWANELDKFWSASKGDKSNASFPMRFGYGIKSCFWNSDWVIKSIDSINTANIVTSIESKQPKLIHENNQDILDYQPTRISKKAILTGRNVDDLLRINSKKPLAIESRNNIDLEPNYTESMIDQSFEKVQYNTSYIKQKQNFKNDTTIPPIKEYSTLPSITSRKSCNKTNYYLTHRCNT